MSAPHEHKAKAPASVAFCILTVSDSRTRGTDASGDEIEKLVREAGHSVADRALVRDEASDIRRAVEAWLARDDVRVIVVSGGTGVSPRDVTPDAVAPLFEKTLPGFGETFRWLSFQEVGSAAMLSRATAGVARGKLVFLLPGSPAACRLALARLVLPEAPHAAGLLGR